MDRLIKTRSLFYMKVHEAKKALIKYIGPVNRVHLTVLVRIEKSISWVLRNYVTESWNYIKFLYLKGLD